AIAADGRPLGIGEGDRQIRREVRVIIGPATAVLDRLSHDATRDRILARPSISVAWSPRLSAGIGPGALENGGVVSLSIAASTPGRQPASSMRRAAIASVSVSLVLVVIKAVAYFATGSVAVLAALADSGLDLFTAWLNFIAIRSALTPADA